MQPAIQPSIDFNEKSLGKTFPLDVGDVVSLNIAGLKLVARPGKPEVSTNSATVVNDLPKPVVATGGPITIGRQANCDLVIFDSCMSREHATLLVIDNALMVRDLGSTNGTFVNGKRVKESALNVGDSVSFDAYRFAVVVVVPTCQPVSADARTVFAPRAEAPTSQLQAEVKVVPAPVIRAAAQEIEAVKEVKEPAVVKLETPVVVKIDSPVPKLEKNVEIDKKEEVLPVAPPAVKPVAGAKVEAVKASPPPPPSADNDDTAPWWEQQKKRNRTVIGGAVVDVGAVSGSAEMVSAEGPALVGLAAPFKGRVFILGEGVFNLGRAASNEVVLDDTTISDLHAQLVGRDGAFKVVNLLSSNGTFVNGERCVSRYLQSGDMIRLGNATFRFVNNQGGGAKARASTPAAKKAVVKWVLAVMFVVVAIALVAFFFSPSLLGRGPG